MNAKKIVISTCCVLISASSFSQQEELEEQQLDEIVVTGSRFEIKKEDSGKVITKITQEQLEGMPGKSVAEIINATVGVEVNVRHVKMVGPHQPGVNIHVMQQGVGTQSNHVALRHHAQLLHWPPNSFNLC